MDFPEIDADGELVCTRSGSDHALMLQHLPAGHSLLIDPPPAEEAWWDGNAWVAKGASPSAHHAWDRGSKAWIDPRTAGQVRDATWAAVKAARNAEANPQTVTVNGRTWDTDPQSRELIKGALDLSRLVGPTWSTTWTFADNSRGTVTATDIQTVVLTLGSIADAAFQRAAATRAALYGSP